MDANDDAETSTDNNKQTTVVDSGTPTKDKFQTPVKERKSESAAKTNTTEKQDKNENTTTTETEANVLPTTEEGESTASGLRSLQGMGLLINPITEEEKDRTAELSGLKKMHKVNIFVVQDGCAASGIVYTQPILNVPDVAERCMCSSATKHSITKNSFATFVNQRR